MVAMKNKDLETIDGFSVGESIRMWRKSRGLLQKQLAAAAGMEVAQVWAIESNRNSPSVRTLSRLASALRISTIELLSPPPLEGAAPVAGPGRNLPAHIEKLDAIPIMRPDDKAKHPPKREMERMEKAIVAAANAEAGQQADLPTILPLTFPIIVSEGGAEQLAHFLRAYLDVGSAIIHDVFILFECHGIRILANDRLPKDIPAITFYSRLRRDYTIFLSSALDKFEHRRQFIFLTEIGRAFLFAAHNFDPVDDSEKSTRFAQHFAATFLMPASAVRTAVYSLRVKPDDWTFELLLRLKERFGVSAQAFNTRLRELGLITIAKSDEYKARIMSHYGADYDEPMPDASIPQNRAGDLLSLSRQ